MRTVYLIGVDIIVKVVGTSEVLQQIRACETTWADIDIPTRLCTAESGLHAMKMSRAKQRHTSIHTMLFRCSYGNSL